MGFATIDDKFFRQEQVCHRIDTGKRYSVPGSRIKRREYKKVCTAKYDPVIY
mgnify:CR=1 FL=1